MGFPVWLRSATAAADISLSAFADAVNGAGLPKSAFDGQFAATFVLLSQNLHKIVFDQYLSDSGD
jgi:hypothetical protein